jgi:hypothetical protein
LHPLESAAFSRRTPTADLEPAEMAAANRPFDWQLYELPR